jgi:hypothetical protein
MLSWSGLDSLISFTLSQKGGIDVNGKLENPSNYLIVYCEK